MNLADCVGIPWAEKRLSMFEFYNADEVFTTGTMCGIASVHSIDRRTIGSSADGRPGPVTAQLQEAYMELTNDPSYGVEIPRDGVYA